MQVSKVLYSSSIIGSASSTSLKKGSPSTFIVCSYAPATSLASLTVLNSPERPVCVQLISENDLYFEQTLHRPLHLLFEGGFYFTRTWCCCGFYSRAASIWRRLVLEEILYSSNVMIGKFLQAGRHIVHENDLPPTAGLLSYSRLLQRSAIVERTSVLW